MANKFTKCLLSLALLAVLVTSDPIAMPDADNQVEISPRNSTTTQSLLCSGLCTTYNAAKAIGIGESTALKAVNDNDCTCGSVRGQVGILVVLSFLKYFGW